MNREYHKWFSPALGRDMELLVFGRGGSPLIVFPTSMGRFYDYENRHMIEAVGEGYEIFCVDSVDAESWYNKSVAPAARAARQVQYDRYLIDEVVPFVRSRNAAPIGVTGCSFGGYHSVNFAMKHPDVVASCVSMGGAFDIHQFIGDYYDDNCYYNCPPDFLPNMTDAWFLDRYRQMRIVLATGETDICLEENRRLSRILDSIGVPHYLDIWGGGAGHDWPWWEQMARKFF